jgi:E3 ubiquitin-protein ligase DOA10
MPEAEQVPGQHTAAAAAPASDATEQGAAHDATAANSAFCRICHEPAAPDNPLIRPCKCSGTIQHVHHNCQLVWLRRSRRRECEVRQNSSTFQNLL